MLKKITVFVRKHKIFFSLYSYCLFCWMWLLEISLGQLASSVVVGKIMQIIILLVLTFLSALIYTMSLKLLFANLRKTRKWLVPLKLAMWWAATELAVAWAVCIVWYGVGARLDNVLPFTSLSHFGIWLPLGYLSRFVGLNGLSGVMFMLFILSTRPNLRKLLRPTMIVVGVMTILAWGLYRVPNGPKVPVVLVSERNEQDKYLDAVQPKDVSLVIFPEYGFNGIENETISSRVMPQNPGEKVYFVGSRFVYGTDNVKNQLVAGDTQKGYTYEIDKSRLIPAGEYVPYAVVGLLKAIGAQEVIDDFRQSRQIAKADGAPKEALLELGKMKVGAGICSSIIAPEDYRNLAKNGANLFTNSAFLGIFNNSQLYGWQHRSMAKLMATANARTFLQSGTSGPSFGYDNNGNQLFYINDTGTTEFLVELNNRRTPYSLLGEYLGIGGILWICIDFFKSKNRR
jgi:apolipoprotein N-acyltransferase